MPDDITLQPGDPKDDSGQGQGSQTGAAPTQQQPAQQGGGVPTGQQPATQQPAEPSPPVQKPAAPKSFNDMSLEEEAALMGNTTQAPKKNQYVIPELVLQKFPDLPQLIDATESMNQDERDYWYQILPIMTEEQIAKFREILLSEKQQLQEIDKEYEQELTKLNEKHMLEWKEFESKEKRKALAGQEKKAEAEEKEAEAQLLERLSEI